MALHYSIDGNKVCAVGANFTCLATCDAGFGNSLKEAFFDYYNKAGKNLPRNFINDCRSWELPWAEELKSKREREKIIPDVYPTKKT